VEGFFRPEKPRKHDGERHFQTEKDRKHEKKKQFCRVLCREEGLPCVFHAAVKKKALGVGFLFLVFVLVWAGVTASPTPL